MEQDLFKMVWGLVKFWLSNPFSKNLKWKAGPPNELQSSNSFRPKLSQKPFENCPDKWVVWGNMAKSQNASLSIIESQTISNCC